MAYIFCGGSAHQTLDDENKEIKLTGNFNWNELISNVDWISKKKHILQK